MTTEQYCCSYVVAFPHLPFHYNDIYNYNDPLVYSDPLTRSFLNITTGVILQRLRYVTFGFKLSSPHFPAFSCLCNGALEGRGVHCPLARDINSQEETQCQVKSALKTALEVYFRPGQLASTFGSTHGDVVFVRIATGAGKSLCFSWPTCGQWCCNGNHYQSLIGLMDQQDS